MELVWRIGSNLSVFFSVGSSIFQTKRWMFVDFKKGVPLWHLADLNPFLESHTVYIS